MTREDVKKKFPVWNGLSNRLRRGLWNPICRNGCMTSTRRGAPNQLCRGIERDAAPEIELECHRGELPDVVDTERRHRG